MTALRYYFDDCTGRWFERYAGGGDEPSIANTVTEADVLALNFLSITSLTNVAIDATMTPRGRRTNRARRRTGCGNCSASAPI